MSTHISYGSTAQFREAVRKVRDRAEYWKMTPPTLKFLGSVKLHGTNASVVKNLLTGETWSQSRNLILNPNGSSTEDNAGFAKFAVAKAAHLNNVFNLARMIYGEDRLQDDVSLAIYGEWCGGNITSGVALNGLEKMFVIFGIRVVRGEDKEEWFTPAQVKAACMNPEIAESNIYCIYNFKTWEIDIDFDAPEEARNKMVEITNEVEAECPVGKFFGKTGVGEGVVWECIQEDPPFLVEDVMFKIKGEKHSDTKVKTLAPVDIEKVNGINEFVSNVLTDHRLEKMIATMVETGFEISVKNTGQFLKLVGLDIVKEESDTIAASGFEQKEVMKPLQGEARKWFMTYLDKQNGL